MHDRRIRRRAVLVLCLVMTLLVSAVPVAQADDSQVAAGIEKSLITWLNRDRVARGLRRLRIDPNLAVVARQRAENLASATSFSHDAAGGSVSVALSAAGIPYYSNGEIIGWSNATWGTDAAWYIYSSFRKSSSHWALMMSKTFNYVGAGAAYRSTNGVTYVSILFTEARDHTAPTRRMVSATRTGDDVRFSWAGPDVALQTHTAGFRSFDVQYRVDDGAWIQIRTGITYSATWLVNRRHGHRYWLRVRTTDRNGNTSSWSPAMSIWVP